MASAASLSTKPSDAKVKSSGAAALETSDSPSAAFDLKRNSAPEALPWFIQAKLGLGAADDPLEHDTAESSRASPVGVSSTPQAVDFLKQKQAVAATLDASTVYVLPEYRGSQAVLAHEFAHVAQLRSGRAASRTSAEHSAEVFARSGTTSVGGAAAPPMLQVATVPPYVPDASRQGTAEAADVSKLGAPTPGSSTTINVSSGQGFDPSGSSLTYHVDASGSGTKGAVDSTTDITVHADRAQQYGTRIIGPGVGAPTGIGASVEGIPVPVSPAPTDHPPIYPVVLTYERTLKLTDRDGRTCFVTIGAHVDFTYESWARETAGRARDFSTLLDLTGDEGESDIVVSGKGPLQPYYAVVSNNGRSINVQTLLDSEELQVGGAFLAGTIAPATFVLPQTTAGGQFESLEAFLVSLDAQEIARRVAAEAERRGDLGWFGRLLEDTGIDKELDDAADSIAGFFGSIADAAAELWNALPAPVRGVLEAIGEAVAGLALILGLAAVVVLLAPEEITLGAAMLVVGAVLLAVSFVSSLYSRGKEAIEAGIYDPFTIVCAALLDAVGIGAFIESLTDQTLISGKELHRTEEQRYRAGTSGLIQLVMVALGLRTMLKSGPPPEVPGFDEWTEYSGPKPTKAQVAQISDAKAMAAYNEFNQQGVPVANSGGPTGFVESTGAAPRGSGYQSGTGRTSASLTTGVRADVGEVQAYLAALQRGEIGLLRPEGSNVSGADFITARRLPNGDYEILVSDAKTRVSPNSSFPKPKTTIRADWLAEVHAAVAPGRLNLGDPALEAAIRAADTAGRIRPRQVNVDYTPQGQGAITFEH